VERIIGRIADRAHGVVTRKELRAAGVTDSEIRHRLGTGALLREHLGVFRVGHRAPSVEARYLAAVRACGEEAALSGRAAAYLYGLVSGPAPPPEVIARRKKRVAGVATGRASVIDSTICRGIPTTTVPATLVDLTKTLSAGALARACHEAGVRYGTTPAEVRAILDRRPNIRGARRLRRILDGDDPITISRLERRFLKLVRDADLPLPAMNKTAGGRRVDCRWPQQRLTVELDGYRYHRSRHAWERDRQREREARARGDEFRRYSWADVNDDADATADELRRLLATEVTDGRPATAKYRGAARAERPRPLPRTAAQGTPARRGRASARRGGRPGGTARPRPR
jgi:very-short-patch-repair endonuclease